jgi:hypothetical protein
MINDLTIKETIRDKISSKKVSRHFKNAITPIVYRAQQKAREGEVIYFSPIPQIT